MNSHGRVWLAHPALVQVHGRLASLELERSSAVPPAVAIGVRRAKRQRHRHRHRSGSRGTPAQSYGCFECLVFTAQTLTRRKQRPPVEPEHTPVGENIPGSRLVL
jgi:hypothetical protein